MAAGDRKVKIEHLFIKRANPVMAQAVWTFHIENKLGVDVKVDAGALSWSLGTPAVARAKTLETIENEAIAQVTAAEGTPANDSIS
jgi:hypothetical protein